MIPFLPLEQAIAHNVRCFHCNNLYSSHKQLWLRSKGGDDVCLVPVVCTLQWERRWYSYSFWRPLTKTCQTFLNSYDLIQFFLLWHFPGPMWCQPCKTFLSRSWLVLWHLIVVFNLLLIHTKTVGGRQMGSKWRNGGWQWRSQPHNDLKQPQRLWKQQRPCGLLMVTKHVQPHPHLSWNEVVRSRECCRGI